MAVAGGSPVSGRVVALLIEASLWMGSGCSAVVTDARLVMINGTVTSSRTAVRMTIVTTSPGFSTSNVKVTVWPLVVNVPAVHVADSNCTSDGKSSTRTMFVNGTLPGLDTVIVHVTMSPGNAKGGFTLLATTGSTISSIGCMAVGGAVATGVSVGVAVPVFVKSGVEVGVFVSVLSKVGVSVGVTVAVAVGVVVPVAVLVAVFVAVGVSVGVLVGVSVAVDVDVSVGVSVGVSVAVLVGVLVGVSVAVDVGVSVGVFVGVLVGVSVGVSVAVGVSVGVLVGVLVGVKVGVGVGVKVGGVPTVRTEVAGPVVTLPVTATAELLYKPSAPDTFAV